MDGSGSRRSGGLKLVRDSVWRVDVELPRKAGEPRRRISRTVPGTEADAEAALAELRQEVAARGAKPKQIKRRTRNASSRRARGSGGITMLAHDRWLVGAEGPPDSVTGLRRRHTKTVRGTRADAEQVLARLRIELDSGQVPLATNGRDIRAACDLYMSESRTEKTTLRTDRSACHLMCDTELVGGTQFGDVVLSQLDWRLIEYVFEVWARSLRPQSVARYASTLSKVLDHAKRSGWISSNPAKDARRPRVPSHRPEVPTRAEVRDALETAKRADFTLYAYVMGLASIGCRRGELLALRSNDLDLDRRVVTIRGAIADGGPGVGIYYKATKRSDWRDVPITDQMADVLAELLAQRLKAASDYVDEGPHAYVFSDSIDGSTWLRPDTTTHRWLTARGSSRVTLAMLRRFVATELLDVTNGDYRTVASITGNSEETLRRWYDAGPNLEKRRAVVALSRL